VEPSSFDDADDRDQERSTRPFSGKAAYALIGAIAGFLLGLRVFIAEMTDQGPRGLLLLGAGALFGALAGLDLHSTRKWERFGKYTYIVRFILACSLAGVGTGIAGRLLGLLDNTAFWQYSLAGAGLGAVLLVSVWLDGLVHGRDEDAERVEDKRGEALREQIRRDAAWKRKQKARELG